MMMCEIQKAENGIEKYLGNMLRDENEHLRCTKQEECLAEVRRGSTAYIMVKFYTKYSIFIK